MTTLLQCGLGVDQEGLAVARAGQGGKQDQSGHQEQHPFHHDLLREGLSPGTAPALDGGTGSVAVGAEDATVPRSWSEQCLTAVALMEKETGVGRHDQDFDLSAKRTGEL
jgi:hypothetical protein